MDIIGIPKQGGQTPGFAGNRDLAVQILEKREVHLRQRERALRLKMALEQHLAGVDKELDDCVVAARMVGMRLPELNWRRVLATSLEQEMQRVEEVIGGYPEETGIERGHAFWRLCEELLRRIEVSEAPSPPPGRRLSLTQFIRDILEAAGGRGVKSGAIREAAAERIEKQFHSKTVGMILNRLSREGHARREGRLWFSVAASAKSEVFEEEKKKPLVQLDRDDPVEDDPPLSDEDRQFREARILLSKRRQDRRYAPNK